MSQIKAPWTTEQVEQLNRYQKGHYMHPYTCGGEECRQDLIATADGWVCPSCEYRQDWAHEVSADQNVMNAIDNLHAKYGGK